MGAAIGLFGLLLTLVQILGVPAASADGVAFAKGDVLADVGNGQIVHLNSTGTVLDTLNTTTGTTEGDGLCFDSASNLYATQGFAANTVSKFSAAGNLLSANFGSGYTGHPESCVVDAAGHIYIGQPDGDHTILEFDSSGTLLKTISAAIGNRGTDWIDLAADQCTMQYTSESSTISQFNVCTDTQMPDFATGLPGPCYAHRILPDGSVLVACASGVVHLSSTGSVLKAYNPDPNGYLFAMNLDPDGTTFWTADYYSGQVFRIDTASGAVVTTFSVPVKSVLGGLAVQGEFTAADGGPSVVITTPPDSATYTVGQVVDAGYSCTAGTGSTLSSCAGPVADGAPIDTSSAGNHTFAVAATDADGQMSTVTNTYTVDRIASALTANPVLAQVSALKVYLTPSAVLNGAGPNSPLAGKQLDFYSGTTLVCTTTTDASGLGQCTGVLPLLQSTLSLGYSVTFAGDATYLPASGTGALITL